MAHRWSAAIVGFFNVENAGDERLRQTWIRILPDVHLTFFNMTQVSRAALEPYDWVILGGGSIIHEHNPIITESKALLSAHHKVGAAGVAVSGNYADSLTPSVQALVSRSDFFYVRDQLSAELIGGNVEVAPDLSWAHPIPAYDLDAKQDITMILAPCDWKPIYDPSKWIAQFDRYSVTHAPMFFGRDDALLEQLGIQPPYEFSRISIWSSKVIVSMRLHGIMFALQAGKPVIAIDYDDKVGKFMSENGLSDYCFGVDEPQQAAEKAASILADIEIHESVVKKLSGSLISQGKSEGSAIRTAVLSAESTKRSSLLQRGLRKFRSFI